MTLRLAWFATGSGATSPKLLRAALDAIASGRLDATIAVVFCNREAGEDAMSDAYCADVEAADIPLVRFSDRRFRREHGGEVARKGEALPAWRLDYDRAVIRLLATYDFDLGMLAGYKLIFGEEAAAKWDLLNLHPAAPGGPAGIWQDVIWQLIDENADRAGVMTHLATPELDEGPVVTYCTYPIRDARTADLWRDAGAHPRTEHHPLFQEIRARGVLREVPLVVETLRAFADARIRIEANQVVDAAGRPIPGHDLTTEIEAIIQSET